MDRVSGKLTIYFEDPFWVGVFERIENRKLSVAKVTFGVEPKDYDVLEFINRNYYHLQFSPAVETVVKDTKKNPKRAQRDAKKQTLENKNRISRNGKSEAVNKGMLRASGCLN